MPDLNAPPQPLQEAAFEQLFEVAAIANFSPVEQAGYQESLKYYRDLNNVVDTSRQEGVQEEFARGKQEGMRSLILQQLSRKFGDLSGPERQQVNQISCQALENLGEAMFEFGRLEDLRDWLTRHGQDWVMNSYG